MEEKAGSTNLTELAEQLKLGTEDGGSCLLRLSKASLDKTQSQK
ncbi:hypothetical protein XIS1_240002 [Xenorhabdus innexi]|uniref:Uncharacterized protein n=1 Tax=Xenorhabdus innexi TaxID=290109 RepID=A0A1N6MXC7_9GAMM|nr:hypothetical protein XIS1_240002 [Xenorhabdus innexi]